MVLWLADTAMIRRSPEVEFVTQKEGMWIGHTLRFGTPNTWMLRDMTAESRLIAIEESVWISGDSEIVQ